MSRSAKADPINDCKVFRCTRSPSEHGGAWVVTATCDRCDEKSTFRTTKNLPAAVVAKFFRGRNWTVDAKGNKARCPKCKGLKMKPEHQQAETHQIQSEAAIKQQIAVVRLLDEHFDGKKGRYRADWSDFRIAAAVGLAEGYVSKIRRAEHGEIKAHPDIEAVKTELIAIKGMVEDLEKRIRKMETES